MPNPHSKMIDTTHADKAYRSHDMQHKRENVMACITQLTYKVAQELTAVIKTMLADSN